MDFNKAVALIRSSGLSGRADSLAEHLIPSIRLVVHDEAGGSEEGSPASHFGGLPSLPHGVTWPVWDKHDYMQAEIERLDARFKANPRATGLRDIASRMRQGLSKRAIPLLFLAQLSLSELYAAAHLPNWPSEGTLLFFCDPSAWGFDPMSRGHCRVLYFPKNEKLAPSPPPDELSAMARFPHRQLSFLREWTLPTRLRLPGSDSPNWRDEYAELCKTLRAALSDDEPIHRCGGHPQEIQGEMYLECQLVSNGIYCGDRTGYHDPRRAALEKGAADWRLLIQIDSDEKRVGWMWGDAGRIYFWARWQDIQVADFDGSWAVLQCY